MTALSTSTQGTIKPQWCSVFQHLFKQTTSTSPGLNSTCNLYLAAESPKPARGCRAWLRWGFAHGFARLERANKKQRQETIYTQGKKWCYSCMAATLSLSLLLSLNQPATSHALGNEVFMEAAAVGVGCTMPQCCNLLHTQMHSGQGRVMGKSPTLPSMVGWSCAGTQDAP